MPNFSATINIQELSQHPDAAQFGTSGVRGLVSQLNDKTVYYYTQAFLQYLKLTPRQKVFIAGDLRSSTPAIMQAVAKAVQDKGLIPENCGLLPTPALAWYAQRDHAPAIMITGSHIPDDRNGIKFYKPEGEILKQDEQAILQQTITTVDIFTPEGAFREKTSSLPSGILPAKEYYLQRYLDFFPENCLQGLHVGIYQHSGVARDILAEVLEKLGARITCLARSEHFIPVDTEAIREEDKTLARQWSQQYHFDAIISTDGDADRPLLADEQGEWFRGDILALLCARYLQVKHLVTPISSNTAAEKCDDFSAIYRTRIGSPYVLAKMAELPSDSLVGGYEANGGFLLGSTIIRNEHKLAPLPTRDALIVLLSALSLATQQTLSQILASFPHRYTWSDRIKNIPSHTSKAFLHQLSLDKKQIEALFSGLCGSLQALDTQDGLRMSFQNGEIIHFRASGNAPELRCYTESDSVAQAEKNNQLALQILLSSMKKLDSHDNKPY